MKTFIMAAIAAASLAVAGAAAAALVPGVFDPDNTGCVSATYAGGVLHLEKNCPTPTNAAAGADITGLEGQTFTSASFTLASATQCQGGSPRFNVDTTTGLFFLGCNNVIPTDQRRRVGDLHVHRGDDRGGGQPGAVPDRDDRVDRDHDRRPGHGRHHEHHRQRSSCRCRPPQAAEGPVQERRLAELHVARRSRTRATASATSPPAAQTPVTGNG